MKSRTTLALFFSGAAALALAGCHSRSPGTAPPAGSAARPARGMATAPAPQTIAAASTAPSGQSSPGATPTMSALSNPKIDSRLAVMARRVESAATGTEAAALSSTMVHVNRAREIQVYIHVNRIGPEVEKALAKAGASQLRASQPLGLYQAWATSGAIVRIAGIDAVTRIAPPVYGFPKHGT